MSCSLTRRAANSTGDSVAVRYHTEWHIRTCCEMRWNTSAGNIGAMMRADGESTITATTITGLLMGRISERSHFVRE